jgi:hypothetical protein
VQLACTIKGHNTFRKKEESRDERPIEIKAIPKKTRTS